MSTSVEIVAIVAVVAIVAMALEYDLVSGIRCLWDFKASKSKKLPRRTKKRKPADKLIGGPPPTEHPAGSAGAGTEQTVKLVSDDRVRQIDHATNRHRLDDQ